MRRNYEKFTPTPNAIQKEETSEDELLYSKNLSNFDKQLLVWGRAHIKPAEPPAGLFGKVMDCIREERRLSAGRRRLAVFSLILLASVAAFVPVFRMAQADFSQSGFAQFFSLIFSDFGIVAAEWQNFSMSLLETFPAMSLAMLLAVIFIFLESFKFLARDIKFVFSPNRLINN